METNQANKVTATLETVEHLTRDELTAVRIVADTINSPYKCRTLDESYGWARLLSGWFVYRGGHHIAVHRSSGDPRRVLLVTV